MPCQLVFYNDTVNWYKAQMKCIANGGVFVTDVKGVMDALPVDGTLAWTSQMADFSDFVEYKGCFSTKVGSDFQIHKSTKLDGDVSVSKCLTICKKEGYSTFSLTSPDVCDCMSAVLPSFMMNPISRCNVTCAGDVRDICGGDKVMSIYRESYMMGDELTETSPDVECYAIMKYQDMLQTMSSNCLDAKSGYVCKICEGNLSNCTSEVVNETSSWYDARDGCGRRNGVLDTDRAMIQRYSGNGVYWLGLQRWVVYKNQEIMAPSKFCVACGRLSGKVSCRSFLCTEEHGFLCNEALAPPLTLPNKTTTDASVSNFTTDRVYGNDTTPELPTTVNATYNETSDVSNVSTTDYVSAPTYSTSSSSSSSLSLSSAETSTPNGMTSTKPSKTSKMAMITDVQPVGRRRQPNAYGARLETWLLLLGIIAGMLFVFSIAFIVLQTYRRRRKSRSFLLPEVNEPPNDDPFTHLKRQRSFSNPGFHENGENGDVFLQFSTTIDNTRTCDDCSTFTLAKKKKDETSNTGKNTSMNSLNVSVKDLAESPKQEDKLELNFSDVTPIQQTTDLADVKNEKEIVTVSISPENDEAREVQDTNRNSNSQSLSIPETKEPGTCNSEINLVDKKEAENDNIIGQGQCSERENDHDLQFSKDIDDVFVDDGEDTRVILPNL
ncbi:hypothetical protein FSP39_021432 [Pinctada imbricata]|uniref:WSC domain-containing protein n=1 Tax=Pinctada imbricata TaxID=66713 RepID=A0AA89CCX0_PINIB|nr:hypothetical protein FSP39_021432 [Pinctada imbricata]